MMMFRLSIPSGNRLLRVIAPGLLCLSFVLGCERRPSAPVLRDSAIYRNAQEGFRFLVPEGWTQTASANLPPGNLDSELFLVRYIVRSAEGGSQAQVLCFQDPDGDSDLAEHHAKPAFGVAKWTLKEGPTEETVGGKPGTWMYLTGKVKHREMGKEVLCFRQGDRVYSFVGTFSAKDKKARQAMHHAFESIVWK